MIFISYFDAFVMREFYFLNRPKRENNITNFENCVTLNFENEHTFAVQ